MVNVIVLWQTVYIQAALDHLATNGHKPDPTDVARLSPLCHPTINLQGRYRTTAERRAVGCDHSRPPVDPTVQDPAPILVTGLVESRRAARREPDGALVLLAYQDRARWDRSLIDEGQGIVRACLRRNQPGPYQIQAAINAVHSDAAVAADTEWTQIVHLYDQLVAFNPTPVVALNRAVAVAEVEGPAAALALVDGLDLGQYHLFHAIRADHLRRLGRADEAGDTLDTAIALSENDVERAFLVQQRRGY